MLEKGRLVIWERLEEKTFDRFHKRYLSWYKEIDPSLPFPEDSTLEHHLLQVIISLMY